MRTIRLVTQMSSFFLLFAAPLVAQWTHIGLEGRSIKDIAVGKNSVFAVTADSGSVYRSTDAGTTWTSLFPSGGVTVKTFHGERLIIQLNDSLFQSTDEGISWTRDSIPGQFLGVSPIGTFFSGIFRADMMSSGSHISRSVDNGTTWNEYTETLIPTNRILFLKSGLIVTCGLIGCSPFCGWGYGISTDDGLGWAWTVPRCCWMGDGPYTLALLQDDILFSGYLDGLYRSTDLYTTWTKISEIVPEDLLTLPSGGMLAGTNGAGIYLFGDNGDSLGTLNEGLTNLNVHTLAMDSLGYAYAGTDSGVFEVSVPNIVGVKERVNPLPVGYKLAQNYPNPFNPSTAINYQLPTQSHVTLKVFDVLGREVATLVNEVEQPGYKSVTFDASRLSSGMYFYRLQAGNYVDTKKLLLLR